MPFFPWRVSSCSRCVVIWSLTCALLACCGVSGVGWFDIPYGTVQTLWIGCPVRLCCPPTCACSCRVEATCRGTARPPRCSARATLSDPYRGCRTWTRPRCCLPCSAVAGWSCRRRRSRQCCPNGTATECARFAARRPAHCGPFTFPAVCVRAGLPSLRVLNAACVLRNGGMRVVCCCACRDSNLPGYLTVVAEEVRNLAAGGATVEEISAMVSSLPHHILDLLTVMLDRICGEHGSSPIALLFGALIRLARAPPGGCTEDELQVLVQLLALFLGPSLPGGRECSGGVTPFVPTQSWRVQL